MCRHIGSHLGFIGKLLGCSSTPSWFFTRTIISIKNVLKWLPQNFEGLRPKIQFGHQTITPKLWIHFCTSESWNTKALIWNGCDSCDYNQRTYDIFASACGSLTEYLTCMVWNEWCAVISSAIVWQDECGMSDCAKAGFKLLYKVHYIVIKSQIWNTHLMSFGTKFKSISCSCSVYVHICAL